jgi:hypothetical protein
MKHGFGKMQFPNGDIYEGEWSDNHLQGEGTYTYKKSSDIYSGSWVFDFLSLIAFFLTNFIISCFFIVDCR